MYSNDILNCTIVVLLENQLFLKLILHKPHTTSFRYYFIYSSADSKGFFAHIFIKHCPRTTNTPTFIFPTLVDIEQDLFLANLLICTYTVYYLYYPRIHGGVIMSMPAACKILKFFGSYSGTRYGIFNINDNDIQIIHFLYACYIL